jgi:hypothetical protein
MRPMGLAARNSEESAPAQRGQLSRLGANHAHLGQALLMAAVWVPGRCDSSPWWAWRSLQA